MQQLSFEDLTYHNWTHKTRKQQLLERMDALLPWKNAVW